MKRPVLAPLFYALVTSATVRSGAAQSQIMSGHVPYCVEVRGASHDIGTPLITSFCTGGDSQQFTLTSNGEMRVYGDKCVGVAGNHGANGDRLVIRSCDGSSNQRWRIHGNRLVGVNNRCWDLKDFSILPYGELQIWECRGSSNQRWGAFAVAKNSGGSAAGSYKLDNTSILSPFVNALTENSPSTIPIGTTLTAAVWPLSGASPLSGISTLVAR